MTQEVSSLRQGSVELPPDAPRLRITAGSGSATQKTWNIRRPVTLVGSRRPAHIVLHDRNISEAHCVIINTGREFLIKDLHTITGTSCNDARIDLAVLKSGDVLDVGDTRIQVSIQNSETPPEPTSTDPTTLDGPITIGLVGTRKAWTLREAVTLIGKHQAALIRLDSDEVSDRHAVVFRYKKGIAVFDLGGRGGIWVNGTTTALAELAPGDRITVGPFGLQVGRSNRPGSKSPPITDATTTAGAETTHSSTEGDPASANDESQSLQEAPAPTAFDPGLAELKNEIADAWDKLNAWPTPLWDNPTDDVTEQSGTLEAANDDGDASLRGELHDLQHLREQLATRERQTDSEFSKLKAREAELRAQVQACEKRTAELDERMEGVTRRERVIAQRWSRLLAATCPNCGKPFATGDSRDGGPE